VRRLRPAVFEAAGASIGIPVKRRMPQHDMSRKAARRRQSRIDGLGSALTGKVQASRRTLRCRIIAALCTLLPGAAICQPIDQAVDRAGNHAGDGLNRAIGKALFDRQWVPAPSSTKVNDGLGPLFNARSCFQCHAAATAGRIEVMPGKRLRSRGTVVRLSGAHGKGDPHYGAQIQTRAIPGFGSEAEVVVEWRTSAVTLADGTAVELRKPEPVLAGLEKPLAQDTATTLLVAPSLSAAARADKVDLKALENEPPGTTPAGRLSRDKGGPILIFGRKATEPDLESMIATAFSRDLGLSTLHHPEPGGDCTSEQRACVNAVNGSDASTGAEIGKEIVSAIADYVRGLDGATTPSLADQPTGAQLFARLGCAACHVPVLPAKHGGTVALYSDLRLHDLGEGLAGLAGTDGQKPVEWRTAPLLGLRERLGAGATLLHDGRARTIGEAILWHGGEAEGAREAYKSLRREQREALERFLSGE